MDLPSSVMPPFSPCHALRPRRGLRFPRLLRKSTIAFQVFDLVGPRTSHEAQSLHLRYGLVVALSTLNPYRYLYVFKTRFRVGRLFPFPGWELHPLEAPGLPRRTEEFLQVHVDDIGVPLICVFPTLSQCIMSASLGSETIACFSELRFKDGRQYLRDGLL